MSNAQETWYGSAHSTLLRSSIDFFPTRPESHGRHLYANAQVGLWFGHFMQPDWDMFQSGHEWGAFHAAARAVSGGPVYVSDKPGVHDFALLKRLVCSDGSVLCCDGVGVPTRDVLCHDPTREDVLLKIWNTSGKAGVVGAFNARVGEPGSAGPVLRGNVSARDVPTLGAGPFACFLHVAQELRLLNGDDQVSLELPERGFELCTFVPLEQGFAPIGLSDKLNSAAAISHVFWPSATRCELALRDGGAFLAYCERPPTAVSVAGEPTPFSYEATSRSLRVASAASGRHALVVDW
jgi:raffinose synthase